VFAAQVIGVGNACRGDDGIGPLVVGRLLERELPPGVCVSTHDGETMSLLAAWEDSDTIIVIDAVDCGAPPGTVVCLDGEDVRPTSGLLAGSSHALGVAHAILLARALGRSPKTLIVFGVQGEQFALSSDLSPSVRGAVETLADRVIALLDDLINPRLEPATLTIRAEG
jgi:hydrogenase maturation protease